MQIFKKLLSLLTPVEKKHAFFLLVMIILMALLDTLGVASILPFMAVLTNPEHIETNFILNEIFQFSKSFGVEDSQEFLFFLGIVVFVLLITSLTFKAITTYSQFYFVRMREYSIGKRLLEGYLHQPYSWYLNRHSADLGKTILSEVSTIIGSGINPLIELISKSIVTISIITLLFIVDPYLALIVGLSLAGVYGCIFYFIRQYLKQIGKRRLSNNELRFLAVSEAFGAIKEVKASGLEEYYVRNFSKSSKIYAQTLASAVVIKSLPRFVLEAIAFGGILLIMLFVMSKSGTLNNALPVISLYVFAGYRLMPALQQIYGSLTQLAFIEPSLNKLNDDLKNLRPIYKNYNENLLFFNNQIQLKNVSFNYPNSSKILLNSINLNIPIKSKVGIVGTTGCGKTTIVDIILGLLEVQKGSVEIDGKVLNRENLRSWQKLIGYVPQNTHLSNDTIAANIAFGEEIKNINLDTVYKVSKIANLHEFVKSELPKQYQTVIGERGVKLSGGQKQRIAIARALYHNPKILILDEATSALDGETEEVVMEAINNLENEITIILIAHRLNTVKKCDIIFKIENGKVFKQMSYEDLIHSKKK